MFKEGDNGREASGQWRPKVKTHIREHKAERLWEKRRAGTWAERFHSRAGAGGKELGEALQRCGDWAVTGWIRSLTPHCYLVARTYKKWRMKADDSCLCGEGVETFLHMQLACKLNSRRAAIQGAHDDVMRVLEEEIMREATPDRRGVWDTRVKDLCLQILSVADKEILVRRRRTPGTMYTERRHVDEGRRKEEKAGARQTAMGKRRQGETPNPNWARRDMEIEVGNQKPDGVILDTRERMIYIIEGARCSDTEEAMETVEVTKIHKYRALREELRRRYSGYHVKQLNFIIGIQGTIVEHSWRCNLTTLGIEKGRQDKIIRRCMFASIEGMQRVLRAVESGGGEQGGSGREGRGGRDV
jgi:hypothetical protein